MTWRMSNSSVLALPAASFARPLSRHDPYLLVGGFGIANGGELREVLPPRMQELAGYVVCLLDEAEVCLGEQMPRLISR